jgi:hypothetical protein
MNYEYDVDEINNCGLIMFNDKQVIVDVKDMIKIINCPDKFTKFDTTLEQYPYYMRNLQRITFLKYLYELNDPEVTFVFKNNNIYDLQRDNVSIQHKYHQKVIDLYTITCFNKGHHPKNGKEAYIMKNPIWTTDKNKLLMYCNQDTLCELCHVSYNKVLEFEKEHNNGNKMTFYKQPNGYIYASYLNTALSIHQIITGCYGNGKGTKNISVDHIDRNPLNNSWDNLRIATREEQEQNSKGIMKDTKRVRSANSKELPEGITQELMGRSIYYNKETYGNHGKTRDFFRVIWEGKEKATSKAEKFTIIEKLAQAKQMLSDLENDSYVPPAKATPKYIRLIEKTPTKLCLEYERRITNEEEKTIKQTMKLSFTITDVNKQQEIIYKQLGIFKDKIKDKYDFNDWEF